MWYARYPVTCTGSAINYTRFFFKFMHEYFEYTFFCSYVG